MSKCVEKIDIIFENCETLTIPIERIGKFVMDDFHKSVHRTAVNAINEWEIANTIFIEIYNRKRTKKLYRICNYQDITQIWLTFDDLSEKCICVDYQEPDGHEDDLGAPNINQSAYVTDKGDILLTIAKNKTWHDFMNLDEKLDKDDIRYSLYDIKESDDVEGNIFTPDYYEESKLIEKEQKYNEE